MKYSVLDLEAHVSVVMKYSVLYDLLLNYDYINEVY